MVKVVIYISRSRHRRDEKIKLNTDFNFKIGDVVTFPDRMARANSYCGIRVIEIKKEIYEKKWYKRWFGVSEELVVLVRAEEL